MPFYPDSMQYVDPITGISTPYGMLFPPGGRVAAYVRDGRRDGDEAIASKMCNSVAHGMARCKSGYGDVIFCMPGHAEDVSATGLAGLKPGTTIIGLGDPGQSTAPTFTWRGTTSNWAIDDANVTIAGLRLVLGGANGVTNAMTFSAAGCRFVRNELVLATSATLRAIIGMTVAAGATGLKIRGNRGRGATGTTTEVILVSGAADNVEISDNDLAMLGSAAGTGVIHGSAAATNLRILRNILANYHASSTAALSWTDVAATGVIADCRLVTMNDGVATAQGIVLAGVTNNRLRCFECYNNDEPGRNGTLSPAALAT